MSTLYSRTFDTYPQSQSYCLENYLTWSTLHYMNMVLSIIQARHVDCILGLLFWHDQAHVYRRRSVLWRGPLESRWILFTWKKETCINLFPRPFALSDAFDFSIKCINWHDMQKLRERGLGSEILALEHIGKNCVWLYCIISPQSWTVFSQDPIQTCLPWPKVWD